VIGWLLNFVRIMAQVLNLAILARVLVSWLPISRESAFVQLLYGITEPILGPIRRILPGMGGLDLSPMIGLILIWVAQTVLIRIILMLA
jgi:YggT family protein